MNNNNNSNNNSEEVKIKGKIYKHNHKNNLSS